MELQDGRVINAGPGWAQIELPGGRVVTLTGDQAEQAIARSAMQAAAFSEPDFQNPAAAPEIAARRQLLPPSGPLRFIDPSTNPDVSPDVLERFAGKRLPVSIRNNNMGAVSIPGRVGLGGIKSSWPARQGGFIGTTDRPPGEGGWYPIYATPEHGVAVASRNLERYGRKGTNTAVKITNEWAEVPGKYPDLLVKSLRAAGFDVDKNTPLDLSDPEVRIAILKGKSAHESGAGIPVYADEVYERGARYQFRGSEGAEERLAAPTIRRAARFAVPYQQAARGLGEAGLRDIGDIGRERIAAAPVEPVYRAPLAPAVRMSVSPAGTMGSPLPVMPVLPVTRSPLPAPQGMPTNRPSHELAAMRPASASAADAELDKLRAAYAQLAAARLAGALMQMVPAAAPKATPAAPDTTRLIRKEPVTNPISGGRSGGGLGGGFSGGAGGLGGGRTGGMGGLGENYGGL